MKTGKLIAKELSNNCEDFEWDDINYLTARAGKSEFWFAEVNNFGWRSISGIAYFRASKLTDILSSILPKTECTFNIYNYGKDGLAIQNYHHDSCTGNEWYYIKPISETTYRKKVA